MPVVEGKNVPVNQNSAQRSFTLQGPTIANLVRSFITVKTHPQRLKMRLSGRQLAVRKDGYAEWQIADE